MNNAAIQKAGLVGLIVVLGAVLLWGLLEMGFLPKRLFEPDPAEFAGADIETSLIPSAESGNVRSQWLLGLVYLTGEDAPQDFAKAAAWFRRAAEQGHPAAQLNLGRMYQLGEGVERDPVRAYKWMSLATDGFPESEGRGQAESARDIIGQQLKPEELARAKALLAKWKPKTEGEGK
ncbi:MAG: sel1 repeat family protein [Alphaproteobacteria bacterium]|nr:sel1 repeat family protein [Alphaproteobacteria bacterium]